MSRRDDRRERALGVRGWIDTLSGADPMAGVERLETAAALAEWLRDEAITFDERFAIIESLPERLRMYELGAVLLPVIDGSVGVPLRAAALKAYATKGDVNVLVRMPSKPDPEIRRLVVETLDDMATRPRSPIQQAHWERMMTDLGSGDAEKIRLATSKLALSFGRDREALAILRERLGDDDPGFRQAAAFGLGFAGEFGPLIERCRFGAEDDAEVRRIVAFYIGAFFTGGADEVDTLTSLLGDPDPGVAREARKRLRALGLLPRPTRKTSTKDGVAGEGRWPQLLRRLNDRWFGDEDYLLDLPDDVVEHGWLGYPPASPDQIAAAEARLGVDLPPSFRQFIAVSNGWRRVAPEAGELLPVESIDWFAAEHQEWIDAYSDTEEHTGLKRAILLSDGAGAVILLATEIPGAPGESQAWYFANWIPGALTFVSFEHLITWASESR